MMLFLVYVKLGESNKGFALQMLTSILSKRLGYQ